MLEPVVIYILVGITLSLLPAFWVINRLRAGTNKNGLRFPVSRNSSGTLKENELLLETMFEDAPVPMVLLNENIEMVKINKAGREIGIDPENEVVGQLPGNAFNCITALHNNQGCGNGKECTKCRMRLTVQKTFNTKASQNKIPTIMVLQQNLVEATYNFLISTSYLELNSVPMTLMVLEDVTSIINAEKALIDSEFRYKQITRAITDYIYTVIIHENDELQTVHTPACIKITGYNAEEFEVNPSLWFDIIYDADKTDVHTFFKKLKSSRENIKIEHRIVRKDGTICWVSNTLVIKAYRKDKAIQFDGIIRDITERKSAEEALENQNKLFNTMLDNLPIGIFMIDSANGMPLLANKHAELLLGKGIVPADIESLNVVYKAYLAGTNTPYPFEEMPLYLGCHGKESHVDNMEVEQPDGKRVLLEIVGCPVYDTNNRNVASLVGFYDITERKNAEIALRESEEKLSLIFDYAHIGISLSDDKGIVQYMNPAFCKLLGYKSDQAIGKSFRMFTDPQDVDAEIALFNKLRKNETNVLSYEKRYLRDDGQYTWVQLQVSCFRNLKGEVTNFIALVEDISERKKSIEILKSSEEKFRNIFNTSNDGILITDLKGNILEVNKITIDRSGLSLDMLKKSNIIKMIAPDDRENALYQLANIKNSKGFLQTSYINGKGQKQHIEIVGHTINFDGKEAILIISRDITERKIMQQKIMNAIIEAEEKERNFFSQELHDGIGPILSTIKLYLQWIQSPGTKSDKSVLMNDALNTIEDAIVSVKEISNKLSPNVLKKFGLETAIQSFVRKIGNLANVQFTVDIRLSQRIRPEIETMLYRVFVEAINNSLKYAEASHIYIEINADENSLSAIFRDNGKGFEIKPALEKISGNGLFNMQNRVQTYEGSFTLKSHPGRGTEIKIALPSHKYLNTQLN